MNRLIARAIKAIDERDGKAWNDANIELFDVFSQHCENPLLVALYRSTRDGLMQKLRADGIVALLAWDLLAGDYEVPKETVEAGNLIGAELATDFIHHLPHRRA